MTKDTAKRMIKGHPLKRQQEAQRDIDERAYIEERLVPVFELDGNNYQFTAMYRFRANEGEYVFGRAMSIDELCAMQAAAAPWSAARLMWGSSPPVLPVPFSVMFPQGRMLQLLRPVHECLLPFSVAQTYLLCACCALLPHRRCLPAPHRGRSGGHSE